jgi:excisionase family DNA binding protein
VIWLTVVRGALVLSFATALMQLHDFLIREVKPNRIYSTKDAARYLGLDRREVIKLAKENKLRGKIVNGNYRIPGQSILEYLSR